MAKKAKAPAPAAGTPPRARKPRTDKHEVLLVEVVPPVENAEATESYVRIQGSPVFPSSKDARLWLREAVSSGIYVPKDQVAIQMMSKIGPAVVATTKVVTKVELLPSDLTME